MKLTIRLLASVACAWGGGVLCEGSIGGAIAAWLVCVTAILAAAVITGRREIVILAALFAGGAASAAERARADRGMTAVAAAAAAPAGSRAGAAAIFEGVVARPVERGDGWRRAYIDVEGQASGGRLIGVSWRAAVTDQQDGTLLPGDRVRFRGAPRLPIGYANPGAFDRARYWQAQGVDALVSAAPPGIVRVAVGAERGAWIIGAGEMPGWRWAGWARERARRAILPGGGTATDDGRALLAALVIGERSAVPPRIEETFRKAGVSHVLSVSGLHLAAVSLLLFRLARSLWLRKARLAVLIPADRAAAIIAAPVAIAYTMMTGAETATVRALVATLVALGGAALGRRIDGWTALAAAALAILVLSPWSVYDPSFQLSFAAAAALLVAARITARPRAAAGDTGSRARRAVHWIWRLVVASALATAVTAPITALHFGAIQPAGVLTNLVVVPIAELIVLPLGLAGALLGSIWSPLGAPLIQVAGALAGGLAWLVERAASVSPVIDVAPPTALHLAAIAAALMALAWLRPWRRALAAVALAALVVAAAWAHGRWIRGEGVTVTFLDVGQGDATVIELPGETWLIDAGGRLFDPPGQHAPGRHAAADPGEQAVWPFLRARGTRRLDLVVISHPHPDHYGGLAALARHMPIGELWITGDDAHDPRWDALLADLAARGVRVTIPAPGQPHARAGARLLTLAPAAPDPDRSVNDNSLVVRLDYAGRSILFTGDVEGEGEAALPAAALTHVDIVKVPHHGSRTSSSPALVAATTPSLAIVSCGRRNRFGFPAPQVVDRWLASGARVLRTDRDGAITVRIAPSGTLHATPFVSPRAPHPTADR